VAALSAAADVKDICVNLIIEGETKYWENVFGDLTQVENSESDLFALASKLKASGKPLPKVYMWCGTEDFLYHQNVKMKKHLTNLDFDLTYEESPGDHQWKYWDEKIQTVLKWMKEML
jgi:putative tributyrin esterase